MEFKTSDYDNDHILHKLINSRQPAERTQECDSRHWNILGHLDVMIEVLHGQPGCNLTLEPDHLLEVMMAHITAEDRFMEQVGFPQDLEHRFHHHFLCASTAELCHRFSMSQNIQVNETIHIRLLWMKHIQMHDRAFEEFLAT